MSKRQNHFRFVTLCAIRLSALFLRSHKCIDINIYRHRHRKKKIHVSRPFINKLETHREMYTIPFSEFIIGGGCRVNDVGSSHVCVCACAGVSNVRKLTVYSFIAAARFIPFRDYFYIYERKKVLIYVFLLFVAQTICREKKSN